MLAAFMDIQLKVSLVSSPDVPMPLLSRQLSIPIALLHLQCHVSLGCNAPFIVFGTFGYKGMITSSTLRRITSPLTKPLPSF
uniref:Putative ovule protein n=1 Tax=Solanum chacoense TaxID=4108 RepID=A0A0V0H1W1_SOLCH